eukprot:CAMPEP_0113847676 /NCGR_PEP_ID=MMETSP0372-20130328/2014_1 /TAXON_ID=340204 /ORGANISM="Lankesteria abbotti" /LENGTH=364 /DNA_ID=CAMNT_0000816995 /DNA_START=9 /DNA_END=1100 /DNA_ORIENTATION=+ /assembly_acc=CAM_ASM_000359
MLRKPPPKFVAETGMAWLLPAYDRVQTLLGALIHGRNTGNAPFVAPPPEAGKGLRLSCGGYTTGGQDAFSLGTDFLCVADGVGGCGISTAKFSKDLCKGAKIAHEARKSFIENDEARMGQLLRQAHIFGVDAHREMMDEKLASCNVSADQVTYVVDDLVTSTFLSAFTSGDGKDLVIGNIGDGSLTLHRRGSSTRHVRSAVFSTQPSEAAPNQPNQIGSRYNPNIMTNQQEFYKVALREGDLLLSYSDGVIDNMYFPEVDSLVTRAVSPYDSKMLRSYEAQSKTEFNSPKFDNSTDMTYATPPGLLAKFLTLSSRWLSHSSDVLSPFSVDRLSLNRADKVAGKPDDATVVACWVVKEPKESFIW